ncbi:DUF6507 family protein [Citricoccus alkalitolerans]|uniref:DUF6507 family protein n=1 Tax=Citricoccus alkalitolerans TaxID=246603 RepID=A0ABV8XUZ8_9MICC
MTTYDLDPDGLRGVATSTASALEPLETHRSDCSTAVDEAAASVQSAEVAGALLNVWNLLLAPQFEGVEQRLAKMTTGLTNAASHYEQGDNGMIEDAMRSTDETVELDITDAKQVTAEEN